MIPSGLLSTLLIAVAIFVIALILARLAKGRRKPVGLYQLSRAGLFTQGEIAFLSVLDASLPSGVRLFGKVRLSDIFSPSDAVPAAERLGVLRRINQKHVDFLLVDRRTLRPLAGVELDDRTHEAAHRKQRDAFVDEVFSGAGLPLIHVPARREYDRREIAALVADALR